ncbi:thioredoxin-dependent peroxidase [Ceraceosorus bombacis]|uniref:Putative peroxiredoxin n=2 Tax=Ceraceosorus TaxID=401624 RepID=A0A0P1BDB2_9BASI|nr:Redoxin [Ceraceosorus guamensis]PWN44863.1 Redoxin [Ceraceosorus guamensis]CEH13749.1 thioredoxin-dependent peroxidase [Ceraceosorus bombacis]
MSLVGQKIPDTEFSHVPWSDELSNAAACGIPEKYRTTQKFAGKKVVIVSVPGAFTPTCHGNHIPGFVKKASEFKQKGYEVIVLASNDPFTMSGWRTALGAKGELEFASDLNLEFSKALNATVDMTKAGFGVRGARYALIADDNVIKAFDSEESPGNVGVSSAEAVFGKL